MKKIVFLFAALALAGCEEKEKAPEITDINHIVIEEKNYTAFQYVKAFCQIPKPDEDKNCVKASAKANKDMTKPVKVDW